MTRPLSPYLKPGFYDDALARGRHRDIVGGRWEETGRAQMALLLEAGLLPHHLLLDIGAGSLRLGCKAVPYLHPDHYWATDQSGALMAMGHAHELADPARLNPAHLVEDAAFRFPGVPATITHAIAFAVFTHLPLDHLSLALGRIYRGFPLLERLLFTVFLAPDGHQGPLRQPDGVVTHAGRAPYHFALETLHQTACTAGFALHQHDHRLPRGQILFSGYRQNPA